MKDIDGIEIKPGSDRPRGIGASDVPQIVGTSRWGSARQVWLRKTDREHTRKESPIMHWGTMHEHNILLEWSNQTGLPIQKDGTTYRHKDLEWAYATPDAIADDKGKSVLVEAKFTVSPASWDEPHQAYVDQILWQMMVTGSRKAQLPVLHAGYNFEIFKVEWNKRRAKEIWDQVTTFWNTNIVKDVEPPAFEQDLDDLNSEPLVEGLMVANKDMMDALNTLDRLRQEKRANDAEEKKVKVWILDNMGPNDRVAHPETGDEIARVSVVKRKVLSSEFKKTIGEEHYNESQYKKLTLTEKGEK